MDQRFRVTVSVILGFRVWRSSWGFGLGGLGFEGLGFREFRDQGLGSLGFRVQGLGFPIRV